MFEFGGDVALGADEGLFADPVGGHFVLEGVAHFEVVAEHVVVADFQRADAGGVALALLDVEQDLFAAVEGVAEGVEFFRHAGGDDIAFSQGRGRFGQEGALDPFRQRGAVVERFAPGLQAGNGDGAADGGAAAQRPRQL